MPIKVFEWNLNHGTDLYDSNVIPAFVSEEILRMDADIFILTEFALTKNLQEFVDAVKGVYEIICSNHTNRDKYKQNEVLIGWKKDRFDYKYHAEFEPGEDFPDLVAVSLIDKEAKVPLMVIGSRIKVVGDYGIRRSQFMKLVTDSIVTDNENVLVGIDANCLEENYEGEWSIKVMDEMATANGLERHTPSESESSIYQKNNYFVFKEDHFFSKGEIKCVNVLYDRGFTKRNPEIYTHGEDFNERDCYNRNTIWQIPPWSGIPDHAMVVGEFKIGEEIYDDIGQE